MQPENKIFGNHDLDKIATESLGHAEIQLRIKALNEVLEEPDAIEELDVGILANFENPLGKIDNFLSVYQKLTFGKPLKPGREAPAKIELFKPYEKVVSEQHFGTEFATSLLATDLYESYQYDRDAVGKLVILKLDHSDRNITSKNIVIGSNAIYGAIIINDDVKPFRLYMGREEESGISVEARLVEKNDFKKLELHSLDIDDDAEEYYEVMAELDKFINHRKNYNQQKDIGDAADTGGFIAF